MKIKDILKEDWQRVNKKDKTDGMSRKAVNAYRRENPGSKLKTAVTTKPSKLKKGSKASKRRKSYCSRSKGQMNMHNISCAKTPDKAICKARRRWNCEEDVQQLEQMLDEVKQRLDPKCWKGKHKEGTKMKGGVRVNNCVPNESATAPIIVPKRRAKEKQEPKFHIPYKASDYVPPAVQIARDEEEKKKDLAEKWSQKYKNSINCSNPKGFSQKAHCAGKKKK